MDFTSSSGRGFRIPLLLLLAIAPRCAATSQPQDQPAVNAPRQFEVASIKPSKPGAVVQDARVSFPRGRFEALNVTLNDLLFSLKGFTGRVEGGPKWTQSDRYDIIAKAEGDIAPAERVQAVLALLEGRFKLAIHHEVREESGWALAAGKKQPNLTPAKDGEDTRVTSDAHKAVFQAVNMDRFVNYLRNMWHTTVEDQTGIVGRFDFALDMDGVAEDLLATNPSPGTKPNFPDLVRGAVEKLGFIVQSAKVRVDITVIDHAERPTEN